VDTRLTPRAGAFAIYEKATAMPFTRPRRWVRWLLVTFAVLVVLAVAGPFVYIHFFNGSTPANLSLSPSSTPAGATAAASTAATGPVAGTWTVGSGSTVEYRVNEVLLGQSATAVGRSNSVAGHLTIQGTAVTAAAFSVPMDTIHSDKSQRDAQFDGRIMDVAQYPTGTFTLTSPIDLAPLPAAGVIRHYTAHGELTLHGTTRAVSFTLTAELKGGHIEVAGDIPVLFADYNIANPSFAGFVTTQDHGLLEFLLIFSRS
jgi:polyisoprenoid-binding protein YceI